MDIVLRVYLFIHGFAHLVGFLVLYPVKDPSGLPAMIRILKLNGENFPQINFIFLSKYPQ